MQIVFVGQSGFASATTGQRAGSAAGFVASSDAAATNRALVVQDGRPGEHGCPGARHPGSDAAVGRGPGARSPSRRRQGGVAGSAVVVNCAIVQQTAAQSIKAGTVSAASPDLSAFCVPPSAVPTSRTADGAAPTSSAANEGASAAPTAQALDAAGTVEPSSTADLDVALFYGRPSAAAPGPRARAIITPRVPVALSEPAPGERAICRGHPIYDTDFRPASHASAPRHAPGGSRGNRRRRQGAATPAGGRIPPLWVSALAAAAASGAGPSGIAAILADFALVPPLLQRAREGSVVRRPIGVLSRVDVPV